ncbi:serine--tRNA ligase [Candidatus Micrarchaeota archaeon]|nr:serine--tRNA ligase [Candidatus Micrarchaeota archaeon]
MIDIRLVRENIVLVEQALINRNSSPEVMNVLSNIKQLDSKWRTVKKEEELLRAERNKLSLAINDKKKKGENTDTEIKRSGEVAARIKQITVETGDFEAQIKGELLGIPNIPDASVPIGSDETHNPEVRKWGAPKKHSPDVLDHHAWGEASKLIDFERGVKLAGHRFTVTYGQIAKLERALINFMLSEHVKKGYLEVAPPYLVNSKSMTGTGQLPKFREDLYSTQDDLWMIPTAEVPLTNLYADEVLDESSLPRKITAYTPCFRKEAGSYGKDIRGLIRQHQFSKVELVKFSKPENSFNELESLLGDAEHILRLLELPYRVIALCTGDMGFGSAKTYDIEVWVPSQDKYREISSCSNFTDFQARRANIRYRAANGETKFVHTLNGSGLAVGRTMVAILENYQEDKKTVVMPQVLREFMGCETIDF